MLFSNESSPSHPAMPVKLIIVVAGLILALLINLHEFQDPRAVEVADYVWLTLTGAQLYGLLRGREWARLLVMLLSVLGLVCMGGVLISGLLQSDLQIGVGIPLLVLCVALGIGVGQCVFMLWCMKQQDVQEWLMSRQIRD